MQSINSLALCTSPPKHSMDHAMENEECMVRGVWMPLEPIHEFKDMTQSGASLALVPAKEWKPVAQDVLENPDFVEPMMDQLRSKTLMLALCNKTLAKLYLAEGKSWKSQSLFRAENINRNLLEFVEAPMWTSVSPDCTRFGKLTMEGFDWTPLQVQLIVYPITVGMEPLGNGVHFTILQAKTWGELEIEVRKECKKLQAKTPPFGPFRIMAELSKKMGRDSANFLRFSTKYSVYETVNHDVYEARLA